MRELKLWFFRDLTDDQRLKLFSLFGLPVDEIGKTHGRQTVALDHIASRLVKLVQDETPPPAPNPRPKKRVIDSTVKLNGREVGFFIEVEDYEEKSGGCAGVTAPAESLSGYEVDPQSNGGLRHSEHNTDNKHDSQSSAVTHAAEISSAAAPANLVLGSESPIAHLVWRQGFRAADDVEDYYEVARPGDKSVDGSEPFPVFSRPSAPPSEPDFEALRKIEQIREYLLFLAQGGSQLSLQLTRRTLREANELLRDLSRGLTRPAAMEGSTDA